VWNDEVSTELIYSSYLQFVKQRHERRTLDRSSILKFLCDMGVEKSRTRNLITGERQSSDGRGLGG
jgi:hypothetical protein